jgi:S-DNA-T family DNA segregation ATPase FtsK/SpoIIIE
VRVARTTDQDVGRVIEGQPISTGAIRRPWCDDLPSSVSLSSLTGESAGEGTGEGIAFALVDLPEEQRQETARFEPSRSGNLLVIGAQGSGKSELFATLAVASGVEMLPVLPDEAWDAVEVALSRMRAGLAGPRLLLADDLDALAGRFADEYQSTFVDRLVELARDGSAVGLQLGLAVRRIPPALQTLAALCDDRVILRLGSRQDHLMAGGSGSGYVANAPPGAGEWRGSRIQIARRTRAAPEPPERTTRRIAPFDLSGHASVVVVTTRVAEFTRRLRAIEPAVGEVSTLSAPVGSASRATALEIVDAHASSVIVGDPDGWQSNWALLSALRAGALVLIDRCSVTEFRAISGRRTLPPPIRAAAEQCWALEPDGSVRRMLAPSA